MTAKHAKLVEGVFSEVTSLVERGLGFFHRPGQAGRESGAIAILKGPHAPQVKEGHPVSILQKMAQVGLEARHGAELAAYEGDAAFLSGQAQAFEEVAEEAPRRHLHPQLSMTSLVRLTIVPS